MNSCVSCGIKQKIPFIFFVSAYSAWMIAAASAQLTVQTILFLPLHAIVCMSLGRVLINGFRLQAVKAQLSVSYLLGFFCTSASLYVLVIWMGISALAALIVTAALSILFAQALKYMLGPSILRETNDHESWYILPLILIAGSALYKYASIPEQLWSVGKFNIWSDYFLHGVTLEAIGGRFAYGGSFELVGLGIEKYYHYLPFMFSAVLMGLQKLNGLSAATAILLPEGILLCTLGIYVLCSQLSDVRRGAFLAICVIIIPGYLLIFQSGWFDPYWAVFIQPGAGYGIGLSLVVVAGALVCLDSRRADWRVALGLALFALLTGISRFHFFLLLGPFLLWVLVSLRVNRPVLLNARQLICLCLVLLTISVWIAPKITGPASYAMSKDYLVLCISQTLFYGYRFSSTIQDGPVATLLFYFIVIFATVGVYGLVYALMLFKRSRARSVVSADLVPFVFLIIYIVYFIYAPVARNGDLSEYKHRHFPLIYLLFAIWSLNYILIALRSVEALSGLVSRNACRAVVVLFVIAAISVAWLTEAAKPNVKSMAWAERLHGIPESKEKLELARFFVEHSGKGDVFLVGRLVAKQSEALVNDLTTEIIALAGIPSYLSREDLFKVIPGCTSIVAQQRLLTRDELAATSNWDSIRVRLRREGIRWYVLEKPNALAWAATVSPAYQNGGYLVFDAGAQQRAPGLIQECRDYKK